MKTDRELLAEANDLLRSFHAVASREGIQTNWSALVMRVRPILIEQSVRLNSTNHPDAATCTPRTFRIYPEENSHG